MCLESIADYAILPVQDIMGLDDNYRMNTPGTLGDHNWTFKLTDFEDDEKTRIDFSSTQVLKVMEWILAQGANVVPQSPQWFVDDWKKTVKAMMKRVESYINN